jgi:signal transduction histidine kinase
MSCAHINIPVTSSQPKARSTARAAGSVVRNRPATVWHGAWATAVVAGAALTLIVLGAVSIRLLAALGCGVAPGLIGALLRPRLGHGAMLLVVWAIAAAFAMAMTGGLCGPLAVWAATPLIASIALGGLWRDGAMLSFAAMAGVAMIQLGGRIDAPPTGAVDFALSLVGLSTTLAGAAAALMIFTRATLAHASRAAATGIDASPTETGPAAAAQAQADPDDAALKAELREARAAQAAAEADAKAKMRFLANMSHELRTPLNAIMGFSDIMRTRLFGDLPPRYGDYPELIHESGRHLLDLINDVLDMSKIEADRYELARETFDAREPVSAALRILQIQAHEARVQLRGVLPPSELDVTADRRAVKQIVLNLVANALKFTPAPGSVTVTLQAVEGALELVVADTGVGIAPEDLARLGQPFEQAGDAVSRTGGTGLGLSLVNAFAKLHGGDMTLESRLGEGTAVTVRLPVLCATVEGPGDATMTS